MIYFFFENLFDIFLSAFYKYFVYDKGTKFLFEAVWSKNLKNHLDTAPLRLEARDFASCS